MKEQLASGWHTIAPRPDDPHGPLSPLLLLLTVVTGLVDAFSYLELGRVFVANMTGNVVFLAFALGGASGFVWWASLSAVITFVVGALLGGRIAHRWAAHRGRHLLLGSAFQAILVIAALVVTIVLAPPASGQSYAGVPLGVLVVLLGVAMGLQNATARALAVPDLTTTVLTLTLTGISADSAAGGGTNSHFGRRALSILTMFLGGLFGALLVVKGHGRWTLLIAVVLLLIVVVSALRVSSSTAAWATIDP
ncbi:membrane protein [Microlunatus endophyticus]|uniref:Membrane protein n=1 Tax=Microlunatus endophyticus TaxID=1716077 RepID=A0A917SH85_9ACTN|nr:YoaK family protein [Microlunatus endophyticus]GGL80293.1 membrane protein [Microlunatus endophyticus]